MHHKHRKGCESITKPVPYYIETEEIALTRLSFLFVERDTGAPQRSKPSKSRQTWRSQRVRPAPTQQPGEGSKESRHPFALYGSGEKDADIAGRKTHNVGPAASTNEVIFLSVLL